MRRVLFFGTVLMAIMLGVLADARATIITDSLGNTAPGFNDGDQPAVFLVGAAQGGQSGSL